MEWGIKVTVVELRDIQLPEMVDPYPAVDREYAAALDDAAPRGER